MHLRKRFCAIAVCGLAAALATTVHGQPAQPSGTPVLRIHSPFAAPLWRLDVDANETTLVSSSSYKAITAWSLPGLDSFAIVRVPLRDEQRRRAHGVAISPDGTLIAYSVPPLTGERGVPVPDTGRIYVMRRSDGFILNTLGTTTRAQALKFSPDGRYLSAVLSSGCGLRIWQTSDWSSIVTDDHEHGATGTPCCPAQQADACVAQANTTDIVFAERAGALNVVTAGDSGVRRYALENGAFIRKAFVRPADIGLTHPEGLAVSPDGSRVAVGDRPHGEDGPADAPRTLRVALLQVETLAAEAPLEIGTDSAALEFSAYLDPRQVPAARLFTLNRLAWVHDGSDDWIYAAGFFPCEAAKMALRLRPVESRQDLCIVRWSAKSPRDLPRFIPAGTDRAMDVVALKRRNALLVAHQDRIAVFDFRGLPVMAGGKPVLRQRPAADLRDRAGLAFKISADASAVVFDDYLARSGDRPTRLRFDVANLELESGAPETKGMIDPDQDQNILGRPGPRGAWWRNSSDPPTFLRQPLVDPRLDRNDIHRSVALDLKRRIAIVGSSDFLRVVRFGNGAPKILCQLPISEEAYRVNIAPDAGIVVVGHSDGVLRWYKHSMADDGCRLDLVLSVLITRTEGGQWAWLAWLPDGRFSNHPEASDLLSWQVVDRLGQVGTVELHQLLEWYVGKDEFDRALTSARTGPAALAASSILPELQRNLAARTPILRIESPLDRIDRERFRFRVSVADEGKFPKVLGVMAETFSTGLRVPIFMNSTEAGAGRESILIERPGRIEMDLLLPPGARSGRRPIGLRVFLDGRPQAQQFVHWTGPLAPAPPRRLWAVIVGFSRHDDELLNLKYAQNDAVDIARLFVRDFRERDSDQRDFASINIDLIISAHDQIRKEASELAPQVTLHPPTRESILRALDRIAQRSRVEDLSNDLFLFYFSGHGFVHPFNRSSGRTAFATPATSARASAENLAATALASDVLIEYLHAIAAQKLVVLDACRSAGRGQSLDINLGMLTQEFAEKAPSTHFFFSALDGQVSIEQSEYVFDRNRPPNTQGNGLFTYGLLHALTSEDAIPKSSPGRHKLTTVDVDQYVSRKVFDFRDPDSIIRRLEHKYAKISQTPYYKPGGLPGASTYLLELRTLDLARDNAIRRGGDPSPAPARSSADR
jgi:uncharacterized caspase-like protein